MNRLLFYFSIIIFGTALFLGMFTAAELIFYILVYTYFFIFITLRMWFSVATNREKAYYTLIYGAVLSLQILFAKFVIFANFPGIFLRIFGIVLVLVPKLLENIIIYYKKINYMVIWDIITDIPRHSVTKYICKGILTEEYFKAAEDSLDDENVYVVISNTGSAASEFISIFTKTTYNHASLSFDRDLKTIVSFNGGEKVRPPGMNFEEVNYFHKKSDSSVLVYRLPAEREQKAILLEKIREINNDGSAYNLLGLAVKIPHKPNIMYCSQFVYTMLKAAGLEYFQCNEEKIKPTDFIEKDYKRQLFFEYEVKFED